MMAFVVVVAEQCSLWKVATIDLPCARNNTPVHWLRNGGRDRWKEGDLDHLEVLDVAVARTVINDESNFSPRCRKIAILESHALFKD